MTADAGTHPHVAPMGADGSGRGWGVFALSALAVAWLAATLWSVHATLAGSGGVHALSQAALALPVVVTSSLVAGVAGGFAAARLLGERVPRIVAGLGGGLITGLVVAALILAGYGTTSALVVLAAGVGAASLLGGAISAARPPAVVEAAVAGTLAWFVVGLLQAAFYNRLLTVFGADDSVASQVNASNRLALAVAICGGVLAGIVAYRYLRPRAEGLRWPAYLAAGAGPGLLLLLAGLVTFIAGRGLRSLASASSEADQAALGWSSAVGLNTALLVLFAGAIAATIAFGRTLRPETPEPAETSEAEPAPRTTPETEAPAAGRRPGTGPDQTS